MITHKSPISGIASFNNTYVATAGYDNTIILWDAKSGKSIGRGCHDHLVNQCTFNSDGKLLISSGSDYIARVWEIPSMQLKCILNGHSDDVEGLSFHSSKDWVATCSRDKTIRIYDLDGNVLKVLKGHTDDIISVEWIKGSDILVSSADDGTVKYWDVISGKIIKDLSFNDVETDTIAITLDGTIFAGNDEGEIVIIKNDEEPIMKLAHKAGIKRLVYSDEVNKLISLSYDRSFKVWNYTNGTVTLESSHEFNNMVWPRSCSFLNKDEIVFGAFGNKYAQFNLKTERWLDNKIKPTHGINAICEVGRDVYYVGDSGFVYKNNVKISEMGSLCNFIIDFKGVIITGGQTGEVFDAVTGEVYYQHNSPLNCATNFKHNGQSALMVGTYTGKGITLLLTNDNKVEFLKLVSIHDNAIKGISASNEFIYTVCATGAAAYHNLDTFECEYHIEHGHSKIANDCVSYGVNKFASISRDLKLRLWDKEECQTIDTSHRNSLKCISSDASGRYLAIGDYVGFVSVYDIEKKDFVTHNRLSDFGISSISFSSAKNKFLASSYNGKFYEVGV